MAHLIHTLGSKQLQETPFIPSQIPGLQLWLDGKDPLGSGISPNSETVLATWSDKSGNGYNATGVNNPTFNMTGGVNFNDSYYTTKYTARPSTESVFIVYKTNSLSIASLLDSTAPGGRQFVNESQGLSLLNNSVLSLLGSYAITTNTRYIGECTYSSAGINIYLTGNSSASNTINPAFTAGNTTIGGSLNGTIYEVLIFNTVLSDNERQVVEGYLAWKWGINTELPSAHPFYTLPPNKLSLTPTFSPTQVPGLQMWLDGADPLGTGTAPANATVIGTWYDKSGQGYNGTGVANPTFSGGISFNGSQYYTTKYTAAPAKETAFVVAKFNNVTNQLVTIGNSGVASSRSQILNNNRMQITVHNVGGYGLGTRTVSVGTTVMWDYTYDSTISTYYNGNADTVTTGISYSGTGTTNIGYTPSSYMNGTIYEILIFNTVLTVPQRQAIEGYLAWKWNLYFYLPTSHPYSLSSPNSSSLTNTFSPLQVPGLASWYDATDPYGTGQQPATGTSIPVWTDKSGNARNLSQYNSYPVPTYSQNIINTLPTINFTNSSGLISPSFAKSSNVTILVVGNIQNTGNSSGTIWGHYTNRNNDIQLRRVNNTSSISWHTNNDNTNVNLTSTNTPALYSCTMTNGTGMFMQQTNSAGTTSVSFTETLTWTAGSAPVYVGISDAGEPIQSYISEILYFQYVLSETQRKVLEGYLAWKWGIQANLPRTHPYYSSSPTQSSLPTIFLPTQVPGLQVWLDGADPLNTGIPPSSGTVIGTWADKSGNGYDGTGVANSTFSTEGINFNQSYYTTAYTSFASTESIFVVYTSSTQSALVDTNSIGGRSFQSSTQGHSLISSGVGTRLLGAYAVASGTRYIAECTYSTAGINIYVTGSSSAANTTNPAFTAGITLIGAGYSGTIGSFLNGTISEVLIYNRVLTISQRQAIEGYLSWKWNTSLPNNHPFKYFTPAYNSLQTLTTYIYKPSYLPGLKAWYDANDPFGTGVRPGNSVVMSNWYDKSGNSNTMEATGAPTYTTGSQNGLPGITLSGNSGTTIGTYYRTQISPGTFMAELDAFVVYKNTSPVTYNTLITRTLATGTSGNPLDFYGTSAFLGANSAYSATSSYNLYNTNPSIFNINISQYPSKLTGYTNGTPFTLTAGTWTPSDNGTLLNLGARQDGLTGFNGLFYEVMVFNYPLSTGQRQFVEGYLAWKWGLYASLPTSHPYYSAGPNINTLFFQPTQIVGLNLWFDGADPLNNGTIPANGTAITTWSDKSGQGFNATGINTPTYSGGISLNGTQYYTTTYTSAPSSETAFVVVNFNDTTSQDLIGTINSLGGRQYKLFLGKMVVNIYNTESYSSGTNSVPTGRTTLLDYTVGSGSITSFYNGNQENTITGSAFSGTGKTSIGATYGTTVTPESLVNGILYEIIIFNRVLSTPQRQLVEGYLSWKWNLQSNLPTTHPYYTIQPSFLTLVPSYTGLSNISANAMTYLPLQANTIDVGLFPQTVTVNGAVNYSNVLGKACIYFNNSTANYLAFPMSNVYGITIAFWFNTAGAAYYSAGGYSSSMRFDILNSTTATVYTALPNQWTNAPSATFGANVWNFIAVTINQNSFVETLYMNGSNASTATGSGPFLSPTTFIIGKSPDNTRAYQGFIQNFMYFNTVLTGAQINTIYEQTSADLAIPSPPTGLSLVYSNPTLTLTWNASLNATSYLVEFYGLASSGTTGGILAQLYSNVTTTQVFSGKPPLNFYYATVTPVNSGVLGPIVVSSATPILDPPLAPTNVIMGSFAASQTTISVNWTASLLASSYTVNFLSNASNSTSGGTVWQTITGVTGTSGTSSATLRSGINGTYYYATVTAVNSGGSSSATTSSGTIQYYIPKWISGNVLWLDANDSLTLSGNNVTKWNDKSGLNNHTTAVSTTRPQRTTLNSLNAVSFSNSATVSNFLRGNLTATYGSAGCTVVSVITLKNIAGVAFPRIFLLGLGTATTPGIGLLIRNGVRQQIAVYSNNILGGNINPTGTGTNVMITKAFTAYDSAFVLTKRITPDNTSNLTELAVNGEPMTGSLYCGPLTTPTRSFSNYSIGNYLTTAAGSADAYNGIYGEILVYSSNITETHRAMAEGYLAWKWGTTASLDVNHQYKNAPP